VVDVLESLRADEYAYFRVQGARATAQDLEELAADAGVADSPGAGEQIVTRLGRPGRSGWRWRAQGPVASVTL
jgi:hypothetical protein